MSAGKRIMLGLSGWINAHGLLFLGMLIFFDRLALFARARFKAADWSGHWGNVVLAAVAGFHVTFLIGAITAIVLAIRGRLRKSDTVGLIALGIAGVIEVRWTVGLMRFMQPG